MYVSLVLIACNSISYEWKRFGEQCQIAERKRRDEKANSIWRRAEKLSDKNERSEFSYGANWAFASNSNAF